MSKPKPLSRTMQDAISYAMQHDGKLTRFPGGFWASPGFVWNGHTANGVSFAPATVEALVSRGCAEYTQWQDRRGGGQFPIEATIINKEQS